MPTPEELSQQLTTQRRTVDFDTFDIQLQELLRMLADGQVSVASRLSAAVSLGRGPMF